MNEPHDDSGRLREQERCPLLDAHENGDEEEAEALADYRAAQQAGIVTTVAHEDVRRRFGLRPA